MGRTYAYDGRVVKEGQSRKFVPSVAKDMTGYVGKGKDARRIKAPKRIERFEGKAYHIHKEVA